MKKNTVIILVAITLGTIVNAYFWSHYYFQSPIKRLEWQCLLCKGQIVPLTPLPPQKPLELPKTAKIVPTIAPVRTDKEIIMSKTNGAILWKVYGLESTWGKNDLCKRDGTYNGFGYAQNYSVWSCFQSFEIVADKVDKWFTTKLKTYSLSESLCLYNTGNATKTCDYYKNYLSL